MIRLITKIYGNMKTIITSWISFHHYCFNCCYFIIVVVVIMLCMFCFVFYVTKETKIASTQSTQDESELFLSIFTEELLLLVPLFD